MAQPMPEPKNGVGDRHREWKLHNMRWRWLLDSYEGGESYRNAVYGYDHYGFPVRNLIRHKREYPDPRDAGYHTTLFGGLGGIALPGADPAASATDDDYTLRLARTPVPAFVAEVTETHLSRIFAQEVSRDTASQALTDWWADVDGRGTSIDQWVSETLAPLLMVLGCIDIVVDHPAPPGGVEIATRADEQVYRLDRCVIGVILPENMVDWELGERDEYTMCLVCELQDDGCLHYRRWTPTDWTLYNQEGVELDSAAHPFGRVPIKRLFDRRRPRYRNVGVPRYEVVAELQREFYNRDSELILSDTTQAHPLLQGPEDFVNADGTIPVGPSWLLPKKKNDVGGMASYEGFEAISFPKDGAESIRKNLEMLRDRVDRAALLTKPAGTSGSHGGTVSQSGVSKRLDHSSGNDLLSKISKLLGRAEEDIARLALLVLGEPDAEFTITYPGAFDLMLADELALGIGELQAVLSAGGQCPQTETQLVERLVRLMLPGLEDAEYDALDEEIETHLTTKAADALATREGNAGLSNPDGQTPDGPDSEPGGGTGSGDAPHPVAFPGTPLALALGGHAGAAAPAP